MRPIKLTMSAFGPYADKQVLNFEELNGRNIFVISGPTGAGKTTIFDAISYALYGSASGEYRENDSLRSDFASDETETFVELEFEIRGEIYKVNRIPAQKKKKQRGEGYTQSKASANLELPNGKIITKVNEVTNKVTEILGINKDQFKQIVMLPQGEFKKLLLADSLEREGIFRKIFNTYDFEKIQLELKEKAILLSKQRNRSKEKMQTNLENIKGEHDIVLGEYVDFPFVIEKLEELIKEEKEQYESLKTEYKEIDKNLDKITKEKIKYENDNTLIKEKEESIKILNELLTQKEKFDEKKIISIMAKKAKEVKYIEDKCIEKKGSLSKKEKESKDSKINEETLKSSLNSAEKNVKIEEEKEVEREKLTQEIGKLKDIEPKIKEYDKAKNDYIILKNSLDEYTKKSNEKRDLLEKLKKEKEDNEKLVNEIANLETKKAILDNEVLNKEKIIVDIRNLFKVILAYNNKKNEHKVLRDEYKEFEKIYNKFKSEYEYMDDIYKKEQAGILASKLENGLPCPVCGSLEHPNPAIQKYGNIPTDEELKSKKEKLDKLTEENNNKIGKLTTLNSDIKNNYEFVNANLNRFAEFLEIENEYNENTEDIVKQKGIELDRNIKAIKNELIQIQDKIKLKESIINKIQDIEKYINQTDKEIRILEEDSKLSFGKIESISTRIEGFKKDIPEDITSIDILNINISKKNNELENSKKRLRVAIEERDSISKRLQGEIAKGKEILKNITEIKFEVEQIEKEFNDSIEKQGFNSLEMYNESKENISKIDILDKEIEDYNNKVSIQDSKQKDLFKKCENLVFMDLSEVNDQIKLITNTKNEKEKEIREEYSILENNKDILKKVKQLNEEFKEKEEEYRVVGELADLANGKKSPYISFERYVLASYFEEIIDAANIRLEKMTSERYSLRRKQEKSKGAGQKGLELVIHDNYTAKTRDVSSLSGGESFKASLSLALGLSDVVQSNAGGVSLDTMFVDEGFGTLDPQSLDSAIDSLLELQRGGRLVGIISHVEELKERVDAKLEVTATSKGSKAKFNVL